MKAILKALGPALILILFAARLPAQSQQAKYGNDFLNSGAGAQALGMGSAFSAAAGGVSAAYWNVAGLAGLKEPQIMYMHSERFGGIVGYDYGAAAMPLKSGNGVVALSFFRQGVDNIANTLNAWDRERNQPKEDVESYISKFSAADMALLISFATFANDERISYGLSAKLIQHRLGPFAEAWGYSLDAGIRYRSPFAEFGVAVRDLTTMQKMWSVDESKFEGTEAQFDSLGATIPTGSNEYVLPSLRLGAAKKFDFNSPFSLLTTADIDLLFENRKAYYINIGRMSIEPHAGAELTYKERISLRTGLTDFFTDPEGGFNVSPTLGMGLKLRSFDLDYGFASFAGISADLGFTHRISLRFTL